ncbi:MAG TPA: hypothetical protein VMF58_05840 [Rhizomicrobium sp.]|nr:hypothetical protein [Rhizomicrobium sp.]
MAFSAQLTNFIGMGDGITEYPDGGWLRNKIAISTPKHEIEIEQHADVITYDLKELRGSAIHSSTIRITNIGSLEEGEEVAKDLAALLSFAQHSRILPFAFRFNGRGHGLSGGGFVGAWRPPFHIGDTKSLVRFVELGWQPYQEHKTERSLFALFALLAHADFPGTPLEVKLSQVMICIENLKAYWALSDGKALGITEKSDGFYNGKKKLSFKGLVEQMLLRVGMPLPGQWQKIVELRNAIIHRGFIRHGDQVTRKIFGAGLSENDMYHAMLEIEYSVHDLIREYVLRLLKYSGPFYAYSNPRAPTRIS